MLNRLSLITTVCHSDIVYKLLEVLKILDI